jgi:hypothetical protein
MQKLAKISALIGLVLLTSASPALTQSSDATWKEGAFRTCEDFWAGKLLYEGPFEFFYVRNLGMPENFDEISAFNKFNAKELMEVWALYQEDCLYLNCRRLGMGKGFIRLQKPRTHSHFTGIPREHIENRNTTYVNSGLTQGLVGLVGAAVIDAIDKPTKIDYLINIETGQINQITAAHMLRILEPYPKLYNAYRMDTETDKLDIILLYIELLNDAIEYGEN